MLHGAEMAIEEANARGGYRRQRCRTSSSSATTRWSRWISAGCGRRSRTNVVELCYDEKVWALFGTIGGENSHILIRIGLKAELPMMNSADTDPTFPETRIPWLFRVIADDRIQCYVLAKYAYEVKGYERVAVHPLQRPLRPGRQSRSSAKPRSGSATRCSIELKFKQRRDRLCRSAGGDSAPRTRRRIPLGQRQWSARASSNRCARWASTVPVLGSDRMIDPAFLDTAGAAAEGVVAACPWDPTQENPKLEAFRQRYQARYGAEPETYAAHAYDGMTMLIEAIEQAGLNRAKIRDALEQRRRRHLRRCHRTHPAERRLHRRRPHLHCHGALGNVDIPDRGRGRDQPAPGGPGHGCRKGPAMTRGARAPATIALLAAVAMAATADDNTDSAAVGVGVCATCHAEARLGEQLQTWLGTPHARTSLVLATGRPEMIPPEAEGMVEVGVAAMIARRAAELGSEGECTSCHAPGLALSGSPPEPSFHPEDGVQCEVCHGPGSAHVAIMQAAPPGTRPADLAIRRATLDLCVTCHRPKPSHAVLGRKPLDPERAWPRIAHPRPGR